MEYFASDPAVLALSARHWETDAPLDYSMVADRLKQSRLFEAADTENQIILALLDQEVHSPAAVAQHFDSTAIFHGLQRRYGNMPPDPEGTRWQGFFGHLFGYGATYYSYLFDRVLAERVWKVVFASGLDGAALSRERGEHLKDSLLKWGGGRDPWLCVGDALRDERISRGDEGAMAIVGSWGTDRSVKS
jgi:mitochondrial intermediate peptidase